MSWFSVERGTQPIYSQVKNRIKELICQGVLPAGTKIPSSRALARTLGVSRNSVLEAYELLRSEGVLESNGRVGTYVSTQCGKGTFLPSGRGEPSSETRGLDAMWERALSASVSALLEASPRISQPAQDHRTVVLSDLVPAFDRMSAERFRTCLNYVLANDPHRLLGYGDVEGYTPLREWIASYMTDRGVATSIDEVLIVGGFQQGLTLVCSSFLNPGDKVFIENPGYPGTLASLLYADAQVEGIPLTSSGVDVKLIRELATRSKPRMVCVTPLWQNPTGITLDVDTRKGILACAADLGLIVVEDGFTDELCYSGRLIPPLKAEDRSRNVIYIGTMSKILFPGIRVGWLVAPRPAVRALAASKRAADRCCSPILQAACYEFCRQGYLKSHIARMRRLYSRRRDAMAQALAKHMPPDVTYHVSEGGMSAWVTLPEDIDSRELHGEARAAGVLFVPGTRFFINGGGEHNLRLTYCSCSERAIDQGMKILGDLIRKKLCRVGRPSERYGA
ncbi:MAG: PLP-dependent aminotransferase family protein [Bacillota bacterium]